MNGIVSKAGSHSVDETVAKLKGILEAKGVTLFALIDGRVAYRTKAKGRTYVSVVAMEAAAE